MNKSRISASQVRFIKLGSRGEWEQECIEGPSPCIRLGFQSNQHRECLAGQWEAVLRYWSTVGGKSRGKATEYTNQIKTFYTADEQTLWITFFRRKLYWCFASRVVEELPDQTRIRETLGPWSSVDTQGNDLYVDGLSGALTKVQGFRGTICTVEHEAYLLQRLNCELPAEVVLATASLTKLEQALQPLITKLGWKDFELLCDLIFTQAGWQRVSSLGKAEKTIDMELLSPVSGRRAMVQVKSQAGLDTFLEYQAKFEERSVCDEMYFVVHTPNKALANHQVEPPLFILTTERLAKLVVSSGLSQWLIQKTS